MKKYRYYFTKRVNFFVELEAESLSDAKKKLDNEEENVWKILEQKKADSYVECCNARYPCEESYYNDDQWEEVSE